MHFVGEKMETDDGREKKKILFCSVLTQLRSAMKNAWDISQEHNYLHGSED